MQWPDLDIRLKAHRDVLRTVSTQGSEHPAVREVRLGGSISSGDADQYSDVDLVLVVEPGYLQDIWAARASLTRTSIPTVLTLDHQWGGPGLSYSVLYQSGVLLDLTLSSEDSGGTASSFHLVSARRANAVPPVRPPAAPLLPPAPDPLQDTLLMFWLGSYIAAKYIVRNDLWAAHWFLESRRKQLVRAWRLRHAAGRADWEWSKVCEDVPKTILDRLTITPMDRALFVQALQDLMTMMDDLGPDIAREYGTPYPATEACAVRRLVDQVLAEAPGADPLGGPHEDTEQTVAQAETPCGENPKSGR